MQCENYFCIYFDNNSCILSNVSLDVTGLCQDCIYLNIDKNVLNSEREKTLEYYKKR